MNSLEAHYTLSTDCHMLYPQVVCYISLHYGIREFALLKDKDQDKHMQDSLYLCLYVLVLPVFSL